VTGPAEITVLLDGRPLADEVRARLRSVRVAVRLSQPTQCELAFDTWRGAAAEYGLVRLGAPVEVRVAGAEPLFSGEATCVELGYDPDGAASIRVRAYDVLHRLRKRQSLRVHAAVTVAELARALTVDLGVTVVGADGPRLERVTQHRQRDFELLVEVANRAGLHPVLRGTRLLLTTLEGAGEPVRLELGKSLLEAGIEANLDRVSQRVTALGWHPQRAEPIEQRATAARSGRRIGREPDPGEFSGGGDLALLDQPGRSDGEVAAVAQAALDRSAGGAVTVTGVAQGDPRLWAGGLIALDGVPEAVSGVYVLCEVVHTIDSTGHLTAFDTTPPRAAPPAPGASVTLGTVSAVDDPDGCGRVRVRLPAYGDLDAGWLGVVCPGAGPGRGFVALPDTGDKVLVLLPHGEPAEGVVLGSLFGTVAPPDDAGVEDGAVRRFSLRTSTGQSIVVDDAERRVRVENQAGSYVELAPEMMRLHAATDLVLEAPGRAITVRGKTIDFTQG
jgi:phage protein D/phage baseplate assembly protein gpV